MDSPIITHWTSFFSIVTVLKVQTYYLQAPTIWIPGNQHVCDVIAVTSVAEIDVTACDVTAFLLIDTLCEWHW